jgi:H+/Cl- antiporter ClcA
LELDGEPAASLSLVHASHHNMPTQLMLWIVLGLLLGALRPWFAWWLAS